MCLKPKTPSTIHGLGYPSALPGAINFFLTFIKIYGMKKILFYSAILLGSILIALPSGIKAQGVEITPFAGYQFGGKMKYDEGDLKS